MTSAAFVVGDAGGADDLRRPADAQRGGLRGRAGRAGLAGGGRRARGQLTAR